MSVLKAFNELVNIDFLFCFLTKELLFYGRESLLRHHHTRLQTKEVCLLGRIFGHFKTFFHTIKELFVVNLDGAVRKCHRKLRGIGRSGHSEGIA